MGIPLSLMKVLGFPSAISLPTEKIFEQFFKEDILTFEQFHISLLEAFEKCNSIMPGRRYRPPTIHKIKDCYREWSRETDGDGNGNKKKILMEMLTDNLMATTTTTPDNVVVMTGIVAPPAAMILKRSANRVPQLKKFGLDLVPDLLFVPTMTCVALVAAKVLKIKGNSSNNNG